MRFSPKIWVGFLFFASMGLCFSSPQLRPAFSLEQAVASVTQVRSGQKIGSGFFFTKTGVMVIAAHLVQEPDGFIEVGVCDRTSGVVEHWIPATVLMTDHASDIAFILPQNLAPFHYYLQSSSSKPRFSDPITLIGFPQTGSPTETLSISVLKGYCSGFYVDTAIEYVKWDRGFPKGMSGGAGLNRFNRLVGVPLFRVDVAGCSQGFLVSAREIEEQWLKFTAR